METLFWIIVVVLPVVALAGVALVCGRLVRMADQINSMHISLSAVRERLFKLESGPEPVVSDVVRENPPAAEPGAPLVAQEKDDLESPESRPGTTKSEAVTEPVDAEKAHAEEPGLAPTPLPAPAEAGSFEMKLGSVWFVRIGVVLVLTALAFLSHLGYGKLDEAMQKIASAGALYLISFGMLGLGTWLPRRSETLQNYGQVLAAGGLAAVYFTTYSMQFHYGFLSPVVTGLMLFGWAAFIVRLADKRQSELMAFFAISGAFYASFIPLIHGSGGAILMLASNAALSGAAVWFLIRNRWAKLTAGAVVATYVGFAIWRFVIERQQLVEPGMFWISLAFLACYWSIFSAAAIYSRSPQLAGWPRALLLGSNSVFLFIYAAIPLGALQSTVSWANTFWLLPAVLGAVHLGIHALVQVTHPRETALVETSLVKGLIFTTLAVVTFDFTGPFTGMVLTAQSTLMFYLGCRRSNGALKTGACLAGTLGLFWSLFDMSSLHVQSAVFSATSVWLGMTVTGFLMANAWIATKFDDRDEPDDSGPYPVIFICGAAFMAMVATIANTLGSHAAWTGPMLAGLGLAFSFSVYWLRVREVAWAGQALVLAGMSLVLLKLAAHSLTDNWWSPALVQVAMLVLMAWWQQQDDRRAGKPNRRKMEFINAMGFTVLALVTFYIHVPDPETRLWMSVLIAVLGGVMAVTVRQMILAVASQLFLLMGVLEFMVQVPFHSNPPGLLLALIPICALFGLGQAMLSTVPDCRETHPTVADLLEVIARIYAVLAAFLGLICLFHPAYLAAENRVWVALLIGAAVFILNGWQPATGRIFISFAFTGVGLLVFLSLCLTDWNRAVWLPNLIALTGLIGQQQVARHFSERFRLSGEIHAALSLLCAVGIWLWMSRWVGSGFYLTATWAVLAFAYVGAGLWIRERAIRLAGLALVMLAFVRIGIFDIWNIQDQVARMLSVMALGGVLLALGYIYNRHRESIRQWL